MRILVCGGAGYIGSNMTAMLAAEEHDPVVYDNLSKGHKAAIAGCEFVKGDLADYKLLVKTLKKYKIEAVIPLRRIYRSQANPSAAPLNTITITSQTHRCCWPQWRRPASKNLSSAAPPPFTAYPTNCPSPKIRRQSPSILMARQNWPSKECVTTRARAGKLRYASLRYFNACGAGNNCTLGEDHRPESHLIPLTIAAAMGKSDAIKIYGTDYPTPDGTCIRDYIHIEDLCRAHLLALSKLDKQPELDLQPRQRQGLLSQRSNRNS